MSNELIRELVEALEDSYWGFLSETRGNELERLRCRARAYLETGGWTRVEDGLPVVPDGDDDVEVWVAWPNGLVELVLWFDGDTEFDAGLTHWRYAEPTPDPPKG